MLKKFLKNIVYSLVRRIGRPSGASILVYHSIDTNDQGFTVSPENFERQMEWLANDGFNVVSLDVLAEYRHAGSIPPKTVCITIDDGYEDNYRNAFPILKKYSLPATIFVTTGDLATASATPASALPKMSEPQLHELEASGLISIEPHSETHPKFTHISPAEAEREVFSSKTHLERVLGKQCRHFAYPKGRNDAQARDAVRRAGISFAYTTQNGLIKADDDPFALRRNGIDRETTLAQFKGIALVGRLSVPSSIARLYTRRV